MGIILHTLGKLSDFVLMLGSWLTSLARYVRSPMPIDFTAEADDAFGKFKPQLENAAIEAARDWASYFTGDGLTTPIRIELRCDTAVELATGGARYARRLNGKFSSGHKVKGVAVDHVVMEATAFAIRYPGDPLPHGHSDIVITVNPTSLARKVVFSRTPQPNERDAHSLLVHEIGHALGFNGRLDQKTGAANNNDGVSLYDECVEVRNDEFWFVGAEARRVYGGDVPLGGPGRNNNYHHVEAPNSVMTTASMDGKRFPITELDRAILRDCGLPIR